MSGATGRCSNCNRKVPEGSGVCLRCAARITLLRAHDIAGEYKGNLTVRQLYYQLVARGYIANSQESYKRLVGILTDARLAGEFPFEWLLDRTRESRPGRYTGNQDDAPGTMPNVESELRSAPERWLWRDRWYRQPTHVSVWVEKEALAGVFEEPCDRLGVSWFVLRGYSSLSALSQWVDHAAEAYGAGYVKRHVVLYFGDHDPDGWEIPRSAERNVRAIATVRDIDLAPISFRRVALLREQIDRYNPPPFPAKETSSRFESYVREHGLHDAWELDALRPEVLQKLITDSVAEYYVDSIRRENDEVIALARAEMRGLMWADGWIENVLNIGE